MKQNYKCLLNHDGQINLEWIAVKVIKLNAKPFIVGTWCRPPGCGIEIFNAFGTLSQHLEAHDLETNIIGDFNYDIGKSTNSSNKKFSWIMQFISIFTVNSSPNTYNCLLYYINWFILN